jgi:hypothetical protein
LSLRRFSMKNKIAIFTKGGGLHLGLWIAR